MRNIIRIAAILFAIAVVFGCASSKTSTGQAQKPTGAPSGRNWIRLMSDFYTLGLEYCLPSRRLNGLPC
jgi:hypothetical protein